MKNEQEQLSILQDVEGFVNSELRPLVHQFEMQEGVSPELIKKMASKGYLAAPIPEMYGGLGFDPVHYGLFTELFGKVCTATRSLITVHTSLVSETLLRLGTEEQKHKWLPKLACGEIISAFALSEPEVGSDAKNVKTSWYEEENFYVINGIKKWITFGDLADLFIIIASCEGKSTAFIVERDTYGLSTKRIDGLMAARATYLAEIHLNNVKVSKENVLGKLHCGFEYVVSTALDYGRYSIAWAGIGIAGQALESMVSYSRNRLQFNQKLKDFQLIRGMIGDSVTKLHAARALVLRAAELRKQKSLDATTETTIAKYFASKVAVEVSNDALQIHGANGFTNQYPVERLYREAKVLEVIEGSSQLQQELISSFGLMRYYNCGTG